MSGSPTPLGISEDSETTRVSELIEQSFEELEALFQPPIRRVTIATTQQVRPIMSASTTVTIGGVSIEKSNTKQAVTTAEQILFKKEDRANLAEDKR